MNYKSNSLQIDSNYMKYLNKSINLQDNMKLDKSQINTKLHNSRRVSQQQQIDSSFVYIPPHQRTQNFQSLKMSQVGTGNNYENQQQSMHARSRSFEQDLSKKQNTFGLQKSQESNTHIVRRQDNASGVKEAGFISPKFKLSSEERKKHNTKIIQNENNQILEQLKMDSYKDSFYKEPTKTQKNANTLQKKQEYFVYKLQSVPQYELQSQGTISHDSVCSSVQSIGKPSSKTLKIQQLEQRLSQKEQVVQQLQLQLQESLSSREKELYSLREEKNRAIDQLKRQIDIYMQELTEARQDVIEIKKDCEKLKTKDKELKKKLERAQAPTKQSVPSVLYNSQYFSNEELMSQNSQLKKQLEKAKYQLHYFQMDDNSKDNYTSLSPLNETSNILTNPNQLSLIENMKPNELCAFEKTFKCLVDELNVTIDPCKSDFQGFNFLNNEVLESVKTLKNLNRENQKFIRCLKELVLSCAPKNYFSNNEPALKDMWKFIKQVLSGYLEGKRTLKMAQDIIDKLCKYLVCNDYDVCQRAAQLVVENEVLLRISDKVKQVLEITHISNLREVDRQLENHLKQNFSF